MKPGDKTFSRIHGPCTVTSVDTDVLIGVHYDSSTYPQHTTDCWYTQNTDGVYVASNDRLEG